MRVLRFNRSLRRLQCLRDHLSPEHAPDPARLTRAAIQVDVDRLDIEQVDQLLDLSCCGIGAFFGHQSNIRLC